MLKSSVSDYSDAYIVAKGKITVAKFTTATTERNNEQVLFKNFASFTDCISEIYNGQVDNTKKYLCSNANVHYNRIQ